MEISSLKLVYFSPTGTTQAVVNGIASGIECGRVEQLDITRPSAREEPLSLSENELLIIGLPVYMGRIPALLVDWLQMMKAVNTPAVCVVVYGNRVYEDALLELTDILSKAGCRPIAGAAYIGEHSFSCKETPTAEGRPDAADLQHATEFGRKISEKLASLSSPMIPDLSIPGCHPYRGDSKLWVVDFIAVSDACIGCNVCVDSCPTGAIDPEDPRKTRIEACITCCACIKKCPEHARMMKPGLVRDASVRLSTLYTERKVPELFL